MRQLVTSTMLIGLALVGLGAAPAGTYPFNGNLNLGDAGVVKVSGTITLPADASVAPDATTSPPDAGATPPIPPADAGVASTDSPVGMGVLETWSPSSTSPTGAVLQQKSATLPAVGESYVEPTFGTTVQRIASPSSHEYSQLQAFSSDGTLIMLIQDGVGHTIYKWPSMVSVLKETDVGGGWSAPRWLPGTHKVMYLAGGPARIMSVDVDTRAVAEVKRFQEPYLRTAATFEALSEDGQWTTTWRYGLGAEVISAVNLATGTVVPVVMETCSPTAINWIAPSPLSKYIVVQWNNDGGARCQGVELFSISTGAFVRQISQRHDHGDLGVSADGREYYVTLKVAADANHNYPAIQALWLEGGSKEIRMVPWGWSHLSAQGPRGLVVIDNLTVGPGDAGEVGILRVSDGALRRLTFGRSTESSYWNQMRATISPDGKTVLVDSDWMVAGGPVSVLAVRLPAAP